MITKKEIKECLKYFVKYKLKNNSLWKDTQIEVVIRRLPITK